MGLSLGIEDLAGGDVMDASNYEQREWNPIRLFKVRCEIGLGGLGGRGVSQGGSGKECVLNHCAFVVVRM